MVPAPTAGAACRTDTEDPKASTLRVEVVVQLLAHRLNVAGAVLAVSAVVNVTGLQPWVGVSDVTVVTANKVAAHGNTIVPL